MKNKTKTFKRTDTGIFNNLEIKSSKNLAYVNDDFMNNKITMKTPTFSASHEIGMKAIKNDIPKKAKEQ